MRVTWRSGAVFVLGIAAFAAMSATPSADRRWRDFWPMATITEAPATGVEFGASVAVGDLTGDEVEDIVVVDWGQDRVTAYSGVSHTPLYSVNPPMFPYSPSNLAQSTVVIGDLTRDGRAEIVIGAPHALLGDLNATGAVFVYRGADGQLLDVLKSPNAAAGGISHYGASVAIGELDRGADVELAVGAPDERVGAHYASGRVYVYSGLTLTLKRTLVSPLLQDFAGYGTSVAIARSRGRDDGLLAVGAVGQHSSAGLFRGVVYVYSGSGGALLTTVGSQRKNYLLQFGAKIAMSSDAGSDSILAITDAPVGSFVGAVDVFSPQDGRLLFSLNPPDPPQGGFPYALTLAEIEKKIPVIIVGVPGVSFDQDIGRVYVFSGLNGDLLQTLSAPSAETSWGFGLSLAVGRSRKHGILAVDAHGRGVTTAETVYLYDTPRRASESATTVAVKSVQHEP